MERTTRRESVPTSLETVPRANQRIYPDRPGIYLSECFMDQGKKQRWPIDDI
jgi:hypothetical protein